MSRDPLYVVAYVIVLLILVILVFKLLAYL